MRSRSSRLFVVLLHLVGVSTNFPSNPFLAALNPDNLGSGVGIVGVHPLSILLEPLELQAAGGLGELLSLLEAAGYDVEKTLLGAPYWLQDDTDGKCLGPDGFSECGDATLWKIKRRSAIYNKSLKRDQRQHKKGVKSIEYKNKKPKSKRFLAIFGVEEDWEQHASMNDIAWEYALELVDVNSTPPFGADDADEQSLNSSKDGECVISLGVATTGIQRGNLELGPCSSDKAWSWSINEGGVLKWDEMTRRRLRQNGRKKLGKKMLGGALARIIDTPSDEDEVSQSNQMNEEETTQCLWRYRETLAMTEPCDGSANNARENTDKRLVELSVIQYQNSAAVSPKLPRFSDATDQSDPVDSLKKQQPLDKEIESESHLPHTKSHSTSRSTSDSKNYKNVPIGVGGYSERPKLMKAKSGSDATKRNTMKMRAPIGVGGYSESNIAREKPKGAKGNILHHPASSHHSHIGTPLKPRKIPVHPYIAASKNGAYVDPSTDLHFPTDIHAYLGHERSQSGRHTLMGVGLFTKTMLKIKVYSVGLYVPKRDVLADSNFAPYAGMTVEELREDDSFYNTLLNEGTVDKTLLIKLNMQLSTETVRQSLSAEWQLLSNEHKEQLSTSSAKPRVAEERMLQTIQSEENTSNCSCGQSAPPEYNVDESCCARGTEMVFTWRKNGNLELRIDGRLLDTFTDPIIGKGIFHEYLRGDDPMSMDARDHFADGFPFLLAPLAQVKGVSSSVPQQKSSSKTKKSKERRAPFLNIGKFAEDVISGASSRANSFSAFVQGNINGGITNVGNTLDALSKSTQNLNAEVERIRGKVMNQLSPAQFMSQLSPEHIKSSILSFQDQSISVFSSRIPFLRKHTKLKEVTLEKNEEEIEPKSLKRKRDIFRHHLAKMLDEISSKRPLSDEIGVIIEPTMSSTHMLFLYMVHFYLVLLLIVSVPDFHRNRLVKMRRSSVSTVDSDSDHEERLTELEAIGCWDRIEDNKDDEVPEFVVETNEQARKSNLRKSLSYYL